VEIPVHRIFVTLILAMLAGGSLGAPAEASDFRHFSHFMRVVVHPHVYRTDHEDERYIQRRSSPKDAGAEPTSQLTTETDVMRANAVAKAPAVSNEPTGSEIAEVTKSAVERATVPEVMPSVIENSTPFCRKFSPEVDGIVLTPCN
jgi:hypothetical protein